MRERLSAESVAHDATWREIERLLDETSQLAAPGLPIGDFYRALLERAVRALAAFGGAVWTCGPEGRLGLACEFRCPPALLTRDGPHPAAHGNLLVEVAAARRARVVPPRSAEKRPGEAGNPTDTLLVLCPVVVGDEVAAVVELFQRPGASPAAEEGYARVLGAFCARAADFHRQRQWAALRQEQDAAARAEQLALRLHESIDLDATAYAVANEGRQFIGCDRLSVLALRGRRCRALAVSGVDAIDRRAESVRGMEQLAEAVLATGEPLWSDGQGQEPAGPLEALVQDYVDRSHARRLAVLPLQPPRQDAEQERPRPVGALVLERFEAVAGREEDQRRVTALCRHAALALRNAQRHESLPLFRLLHWLAGAACFARARMLPAAVWILIAAAAAAAALRWIPAEFDVEARGELQPKLRRNVFAPHDGVVHRVHVAHADRVAAGDVLVELRQSELELEFARVLGEMQTTRKQLDSVQAGRLQAERSRDAAREDYEQLTAKEEELKRLLESLAAQHAILVAQRDRLKVVSPIAGQVLTWDVAQSLDARPVQRGQALMKVVDPDGPWILELRVPDARIGYVLEAQRRLPRRLGVSFFLAAHPGTTYEGGVEEVTMATELDEQGQPYVLVTVEIDGRGIAQRRPGATVLARIHCGRRSLGYVWFHDLIEFLWRVLW